VPIDCVVFDLGNVLIEWDRRFLYEKLISEPADLDRFLEEVLTLDVNADLDRGVPLADVTEALVSAHPDERALIEAFRDRWSETLGAVIAESVELLDELAAGPTRLFALSNWGSDTFRIALPRLPFLDRFEGVVISGDVGLVKPDPAIFELLCARFGIDPRRAVFVDDGAANVRVAAELGFRTVHFSSAARCRAELITFGLDLVGPPS
jgi:2-haloacid dehalogenase